MLIYSNLLTYAAKHEYAGLDVLNPLDELRA
jgi:hypothetical protein